MRDYNRNSGLGPMFSVMTAMVSPAHQAVTHEPLYERVEPLKFRSGVKAFAMRLLKQLWLWDRRHQERRSLRALDDHLLRDIGLERAQATAEWEKPFWRH